MFAKLMELGIQRDAQGNITNLENIKGGYHPAPKKSAKLGKGEQTNGAHTDVSEAEHWRRRMRCFELDYRARLLIARYILR